jgi:hypothetical protein
MGFALPITEHASLGGPICMLTRIICLLGIFILPAVAAPKSNSARSATDSIVIVFKDGHQQSFSMADIARIEFNTPTSPASASVGINRFLGKWTVGEGRGMNSNFTIDLKRNGVAEKSLGSTHGSWIVVDGEARITWDDGWRDVIRRVGERYEKVAHAPGTTFVDQSDNITDARREDAGPI